LFVPAVASGAGGAFVMALAGKLVLASVCAPAQTDQKAMTNSTAKPSR